MDTTDIGVVQSCFISNQLDQIEKCANNIGEASTVRSMNAIHFLLLLVYFPLSVRFFFFFQRKTQFNFSFVLLQSLDEVNITIETCEFGRNENSGAGGWQSLTAPKGKYNFIDKIIDGITVTINTVNINFKSPAFIASVQVSVIFYGCQFID